MYNEFSAEGGGAAAVAGGGGLSGFARHVFSSTPQGKAEICNAAQYAALAILPVAALNRAINWAVTEPDDEASSFVILGEVVLQALALICGFVLVHRLITYVPTYSGVAYERLNVASTVLAVLAIMLSLKSKFGIKVSILADRAGELWSGAAAASSSSSSRSGRSAPAARAPAAAAAPLAPRAPLAGVQPGGSFLR